MAARIIQYIILFCVWDFKFILWHDGSLVSQLYQELAIQFQTLKFLEIKLKIKLSWIERKLSL